MAFPGKEAYNLDNVSNIPETPKISELVYPMGKGDTSLDGVESVKCSSGMTYKPEDAWPMGNKVPMDATTDLPFGTGAKMEFMGQDGDVTDWPAAWEE